MSKVELLPLIVCWYGVWIMDNKLIVSLWYCVFLLQHTKIISGYITCDLNDKVRFQNLYVERTVINNGLPKHRDITTLCSEKKHPLTFSFIFQWMICRFKQKLQWIYPRNGRFWQCRNYIFIAADDVIMTSYLKKIVKKDLQTEHSLISQHNSTTDN